MSKARVTPRTAHPVGEGAEFTEKFRRGAAAAFPVAVLMHLLFTYRAWPMSGVPSLVVAVVLVFVGIIFRRVRRALAVLAIGSVYFWFFLVYTIGVTPTIAYLVVSNQREWLPWAPLASVVVLVIFLVYRVRLTLAREWARPLDETPGVVVRREDASLWRGSDMPQLGLSRAAIAMIVVFLPVLYFAHNTPLYLFVVLVVITHCLAVLTTCVVAWWVAYCVAVRRWERDSGLRLLLPALR